MSNPFRNLLFQCTHSGDFLEELLRELPRVQATTTDASAWLKAFPADNPQKQVYWFHTGLRFWDMGQLAWQAPAPGQKKRSRIPEGPLGGWRDLWHTPVDVLPGCGPATAANLGEAGIRSCADLLFFMPKNYLDFRTISSVAGCREKAPQLFRLRVNRARRMGRKCFAEASDDTGTMHLLWFQFVPGLSAMLTVGNELYLAGEPHFSGNRRQLIHPRLFAEKPAGIFLFYPVVPKVGNGTLRKLVHAACKLLPDTPTLPEHIVESQDLVPLDQALRTIHLPDESLGTEELAALQEGTHPARQRLLFEEVFGLQCAIGLATGRVGLQEACRIRETQTEKYASVFGFELTGAQKRVIGEILADFSSGHPARRLLQGDVGSGKTAVAFVCAAHILAIGRQVAFMAPTTLLAEQQARTLKTWCEAFGFSMAQLNSDTPTPVRESILALLEAGKIQLLVGTHSLIQERIQFADLGLVVVDEQHRFGVDQRARLVEKATGEIPHLLVMTATPIPRSLALTVYGDLESSQLDELPPGRPPVITRVCHTKPQKKKALEEFADLLRGGEKGFVIVPLIDHVEERERASMEVAVQTLEKLFPDLRIGQVHGRMPLRDREPVLRDFETGALQVLVATTVVEVGMDIPDANHMIILEADRFGLAQLHQLRGRIGRRQAKEARCTLFASPKPTDDGKLRLEWMARTTSGFDLAEADLAMRGPGDVLGGSRQAGLFNPAWIRNVELLRCARQLARELLATDPLLAAHPDLAFLVRTRFSSALFDESSG